jgi:hypothetical protein
VEKLTDKVTGKGMTFYVVVNELRESQKGETIILDPKNELKWLDSRDEFFTNQFTIGWAGEGRKITLK